MLVKVQKEVQNAKLNHQIELLFAIEGMTLFKILNTVRKIKKN